MGDFNIDDERGRHWRNFFEDNEGGVDEKALLHAKRWDLYLNKKESLVKGKYLVEVVGHNSHWRNIFEENEGGVDEKALLHAKRWVLYLNKKESLVKGKYSVEVVGHDKKKVLW